MAGCLSSSQLTRSHKLEEGELLEAGGLTQLAWILQVTADNKNH